MTTVLLFHHVLGCTEGIHHMAAQNLAMNRKGGRGALFISSCAPPSAFGTSWPSELPVQIHGMDQDVFFAEEGDLEEAQEIVAASEHGELFVYKGDQHFFADDSLPGYDASAADLLLQRILAFLSRLDS